MIIENQSLRHFNTFGIDAQARYFATFDNTAQLRQLLQTSTAQHQKVMILGGGSNILLLQPALDALILKNNIGGIATVRETVQEVWIQAGGGVLWHELVWYCIERGWGGIENLSLIPGTVGAAPIQNIGAYGVELCHTFQALEAMHLRQIRTHTFTAADCHFGYRHSIFKTPEYQQQWCIVSVTLKLRKQPEYILHYGDVRTVLEQRFGGIVNLRNIGEAINEIRRSKLPDTRQTGNAGSFFKNPLIPLSQLHTLQQTYPNIPHYSGNNPQTVKIAAAWLIEQCGKKGLRRGAAGVHERQALVLVNYGGAAGGDIYDIAQEIISEVQQKFDITLQPEVNMWR